MPCNCDHMKPTGYEKENSKVLALLKELEGEDLKNFGTGFGEAYGNSNALEVHKNTEKLCAILQDTDVMKHSLEMQIWWRDHQKADQERITKDIKEKKTLEEKQEALSKLTDYERKLLGF